VSKPPAMTSVATKNSKSECSGEECVTCHKTVNDEGVECQWCFNWEHKFCVGLTQNASCYQSHQERLCFTALPVTLKLMML